MRSGRPLMTSYLTDKGRTRTKMLSAVLLAWACHLGSVKAARGDEFSRLEGPPFFALPGRPDAHAHTQLTSRELEALPTVLREERAAFVIVKTDQGNLAKVLVSSGLRKLKPSEKDGPLVPVMILERFETIDAGDRRSFKARGSEMTLFDGFQFDLDAGQVVPAGLGGDMVFLTQGPEGARLAALNGSRLYTLESPPPSPAATPGKPSRGRAVLRGDFAGRYQLMANAQWSGMLMLAVDDAGAVSGHFRSDRNGSAYPVTGQVAAETPHQIEFTVQFPRARQTYQGLMWTEGKNTIAGTLSMLDHPYSFIAVREGTSLGPDVIDWDDPPAGAEKVSRRVVDLQAGTDLYTLDGQARSEADLTEDLSRAVKDRPRIVVLLRVSDTVPFERVRRVAEAIRSAGVTIVRLAPAAGKADSD
jgi:hypothetical protein